VNTLQRIAFFTLCSSLPLISAEIRVGPGNSIQAAIDSASPGDTVAVLPGTYYEPGRPCPSEPSVTCAVVISKDNISLSARPLPGQPVILENPGSQDTGIAVAKPGVDSPNCNTSPSLHINGASVEGFTVRNFAGNGILLFCADNWSVRFNTAINNAEYGIFPVFCGRGRLSMNIASGAHDTGIYVGGSHDARVDHNVAFENVSGFEVENSAGIEVDHNESFHNTAGILVFLLPGRSAPVNLNNHVHDNFVHENNSPNTCLNPRDEVCLVPPGIGILAVAGDGNEIDHNEVAGNKTFGIALVDFCAGSRLSPPVCAALGFDPFPRNTRTEFNVALQNGTNAQFPGFPGADLIWSGAGTGNCWRDNVANVVFPQALPACR
jgi:parallel beta-helix repeat protein